jgi:hypothetical protein
MSTLVEPNQIIQAILIDQLQQGKEASTSKNLVHLIVSQLCLRQAHQYLVPIFIIHYGIWFVAPVLLELTKFKWKKEDFNKAM